MGTFWVMQLIVLVLGAFLDWIGIVLICFPLFLPIAQDLGFDSIWFVICMAVNLQASFVTPPFGYALFYIKGWTRTTSTSRRSTRELFPSCC